MGRPKGLTPNEVRVRQHLAAALHSAIGSKRGARAAAALKARVTRQALSLYMRQKATPGTETLRRLCAELGLRLEIEGATVSGTSGSQPQQPIGSMPTQLSLFDALAAVDRTRLQVDVLSKSVDAVELKVSISFADVKG